MSDLIEDASDRPYVDGRIVFFGSQEYLRGSIPQSNDLMSVFLNRVFVNSGQSEVS